MNNETFISQSSTFYEPQGPSICIHWQGNTKEITKTTLSTPKNPGTEWRIFDCPIDPINAWMEEYLVGRQPTTSLSLEFPRMTPFSREVLEALREVLFGQSVSYGALACLAGSDGAARAVGSACGRNPFPLVIPCHRVLAQGQQIGGFTPGTALKRELLSFEGIALA